MRTPARVYREPLSEQSCEHCDDPYPKSTRRDYLRGWVCRDCDSAIDEMDREESRCDKCQEVEQ